MTTLTYAQLEGLWIRNGGDRNLAPLMAAIALAESSGDPSNLNPNDNGGTQSSFGLWQISNGTHTPPDPNWANPDVNARLAIGKLRSQGLSAWGTYTSGAYKRYMSNGTTPADPGTFGPLSTSTPGDATPVSTVDDTCAWKLHLPVAGDTCLISKVQVRTLLAVTIIGVGAVVGLVGAVVLVAYGLSKTDVPTRTLSAVGRVPGVGKGASVASSALSGAVRRS